MKKIAILLTISIVLLACNSNDDDNNTSNVNVSFKFTHNWDGTSVVRSDFGIIQFTNANGEVISIERLRYLISRITFQNSNQTIEIDGYNLVDLTNGTDLIFDPATQIPPGTYSLSITFGFNDADNLDGAYLDLNSVSWNVPLPMGGGYHFMQLEGKFNDLLGGVTNYQYHTVRANDNSSGNLVLQDTSITVNLGQVTVTNDAEIEINMNLAEWFKNPNQWDLNVLNSLLMPNFDAQIMMFENGASVFNLGDINQ